MQKNSTSAKLIHQMMLAIGCILSAHSQQVQATPWSSRADTAKAMWQERCRRSGEFVHKTVENVDGVFLMKIRGEQNFWDQFALDDPYGSDSSGEMYIKNFLRNFYHQKGQVFIAGAPPRIGYRYVEAIDTADGRRYRYTGKVSAVKKMDSKAPAVQAQLKVDPNFDLNIYEFVLDRMPAKGDMLRYGVTYEDISTREEREYWIAGSSLKIVDLVTNQVLAERIGYMVDLGQGGKSGGRAPWLQAANNACPDFLKNKLITSRVPRFALQDGQTLDFVAKVLKPLK